MLELGRSAPSYIAAVNAMNGQEFDGRPLTVNEATPREERPRGNGQFRGGGFREERKGLAPFTNSPDNFRETGSEIGNV